MRNKITVERLYSMMDEGWKVCWFGIDDILKVDLCVSWRLHDRKIYFAEIDISKCDKIDTVKRLAEAAREEWQTEMDNLEKVSLAAF